MSDDAIGVTGGAGSLSSSEPDVADNAVVEFAVESAAVRSQAVRTCVVTRREYPRERLLRLVAGPDGVVVEDLGGRLPGRGVYVHPTRENLRGLAKRLPRGLRLPPLEEFTARVEEALRRRLLDGIGLARKGGAARFGLGEVEPGLVARQVGVGLLAADTAHHTREKVERAWRTHSSVELWRVLDRSTLGGACGHAPVAVIGVVGAGFCRRVRDDAARLILLAGGELVVGSNKG